MPSKPDYTRAVDDERAADEIFGAPDAPPTPPASPNVIARPISIFDIQPDPRQPRRQIPSIVRQQWDGDAYNVDHLFDTWEHMFAEEVGSKWDEIVEAITLILEGQEISPAEIYQEGIDAPRNWGVIGGALMAVVNLAAEIRRDGLTNPITIAPTAIGGSGRYLIETGERRWLAFHLLRIYMTDKAEDWSRITAREIKHPSVWRQASENTARESLNAISMARQLALLLMDLHGPQKFQAYYEMLQPGACDRVYYAQVADGHQWRVPYGKGEQLVTAMGLKNPVQLRLLRDLLRLPDEAWMLADDLDWTEFFIRTEILDKAVNESGKIALAQYHAARAGYHVADDRIVSTDTDSDDLGDIAREEPTDGYSESADADESADDPGSQEILDGSNELPDEEFDADNAVQVDLNLERPEIRVLEFAHDRATDNRPWFAVKDSPVNNPERLNQLIAKGLLRGSSAYTNTDYNAAHYAISAQGCHAIGRPFVATPQRTKPVSGGEFHGGNGAPTTATPPRQEADPAVRQERLEVKIIKAARQMLDQTKFRVEDISFESVRTNTGKAAMISIADELAALSRDIKARLPQE